MTRLFLPGAIEMLSRSTPAAPSPPPHSLPHFLIPPSFPFLRESRPTRLHPWLASQNAVPLSRSPHSPHFQDKAACCDVYCRSDRSRLPRWVLHMHSACWTACLDLLDGDSRARPERCKGKNFRFIPGHAAAQHIRRTVVKCCQCWRRPG